MNLGPSFIIFGAIDNLLRISKDLKAYEYFIKDLKKFI
jgi:hypothetical protein